jgi:vacuolar-type H+-ATPase subunit E/Vma4
MSLERILQALDLEAERQQAEFEQAAQAEIERIRAQAQAEAMDVRQKHLAASRLSLQVERIRMLNQAKQDALQTIMNAREAMLAAALEATAQRLTALVSSAAYPGLLRQLTQEAITPLSGNGQLQLHVRSQDKELMQRMVQEMGLSATVAGDLEPEPSTGLSNLRAGWPEQGLGGVIVTTPDGRIRLVNTLAARLHRAASLYRTQIAQILFNHSEED